MTNLLDKRRNRRAYEAALKEAVADDTLMVCGVITDNGTPAYFTMPKTATDGDVRDKAFEVRNGRPMSKAERTLVKYAETELTNE